MKLHVLTIMLIILLAVDHSAFSSVHKDHRVYDFWTRAWLRGWTEIPVSTMRPVGREYILGMLDNVAENRIRVTPHERRLLDLFTAEFSICTDDTIPPAPRWRHTLNSLNLDRISLKVFRRGVRPVQGCLTDLAFSIGPILGLDYISDQSFSPSSIIRTTSGVEVQAAIRENWDAGVRFRDRSQFSLDGRNNPPYSEATGYTNRILSGKGVSYDEVSAYLEYHRAPLELRLARDKVSWGPAYFNRLLLSGDSPPYIFAEIRLSFPGRLTFSYFHGTLDPYPLDRDVYYVSPTGKPRKIKNEKYIAAHRLEALISENLIIGLSESVIYGERGPEFGYLIPVNIFWSENHHQNRDDNIAWGIDLQWKPRAGVLLYGELLLDEVSVKDLFKDRLHNRTGFVTGARWVDMFGVDDLSASLEYARLRPFVYTHWFDINIYSHFGSSLGTPLKPNSDDLRFGLEWRPLPCWTFGCSWRMTRHGRAAGDEPVGGEITDTPTPGNKAYRFLGGRKEIRSETFAFAQWEPLETVLLMLTIGLIHEEGIDYTLMKLEIGWNL